MRGISGVPADDDRHQGFMDVIKANPGIKVVKRTSPTGRSGRPVKEAKTS